MSSFADMYETRAAWGGMPDEHERAALSEGSCPEVNCRVKLTPPVDPHFVRRQHPPGLVVMGRCEQHGEFTMDNRPYFTRTRAMYAPEWGIDHVDTVGAGGEHFMVCDADEDCPCIDYDEEH